MIMKQETMNKGDILCEKALSGYKIFIKSVDNFLVKEYNLTQLDKNMV